MLVDSKSENHKPVDAHEIGTWSSYDVIAYVIKSIFMFYSWYDRLFLLF